MIRRVVLPVLAGLVVYYAVFGGEYTALDLRSFRAEIRESRAEVEELRRETERLRARADSLETSDELLERLARERFGMIRDGEILYRFAEPADEEGPGLRDGEPREPGRAGGRPTPRP